MNPEYILSQFKSGNGFGISNSPGVYAIYLVHEDYVFKRIKPMPMRLVYIGSSKNMYKRVYSPNHLFRKLYDRQIDSKILVVAKAYETDDYRELEKILIKYFQPILNKQHK